MMIADSLPCTSDVFAEMGTVILQSGHGLRFRAGGASMWPLVRDGDILLVRPLHGRPARVGEVVLCSLGPGTILVHRVIRRQAGEAGELYTVQGDAASQPDGFVPEAHVYGRVVAIERGAAKVDMRGLLMRLLGRLVAGRSRWRLTRSRVSGPAKWIAKKLPVVGPYVR